MSAVMPPPHDYRWPTEGSDRAPYWVFSEPAIYEREQARLFRGPVWHYLGLECEVPEPGSFRTTRIGDAPIIMCRDEAGAVRAMVNRCAHRGNIVCMKESGKSEEFYCVYHAWIYDLKGNLTSAAFRRGIKGEGGLPDDFRLEDHGMRKLRVETFCGLVFATYSAETPPLAEWLGDVGAGIRRVLKKPLKVLGYDTQRLASNWKNYHENPRDSYHANILHSFYGTFGLSRQNQESGMIISQNGRHQYFYTKAGTDRASADYKQESTSLRSHNSDYKLEDTTLLQWTDEFGDGVSIQILSVYPTFVLHQIANSFATRQLVPNGPLGADINWTYFGFADDSPELTDMRLIQTNLVGSAGMVSMEDAAVCNMIRRAIAGSETEASIMQMGGKDLTSGGSSKLSERGLRNFWHAYRTDLGL